MTVQGKKNFVFPRHIVGMVRAKDNRIQENEEYRLPCFKDLQPLFDRETFTIHFHPLVQNNLELPNGIGARLSPVHEHRSMERNPTLRIAC